MSATTSGVTTARKEQSCLQVLPLDNADTLSAINCLCKVMESAFGPFGKLKMIHNSNGGHVVMTSSSARVLQNLSISRPVLKLVTTALQGHIAGHSDGGTFASILSLNLIAKSCKLNVHRLLLTEIYELLCSESVKYLQSLDCFCKICVNFADVVQLQTLIRSVISTKGMCGFQGNDLNHICFLIIQSFVKIFPNSQNTEGYQSYVHYLCIEGWPISKSYLLEGVLFQTPQVATYRKRPLVLKTETTGTQPGLIKVVLFGVSLAGDTEEFVEASYEIQEAGMIEETALETLMRCVSCCVEAGAGMVLCQKVVHPKVKKYLVEKGVLVLDRLGSKYFTAVHKLTGGDALGSINVDMSQIKYGWLESVEHRVIENKSYLHLHNSQSAVCTLVLCNSNEEALAEMKHVCEVAQHVLQMTLHQPYGLMGGGCWQTHLAAFVQSLVKEHSDKWTEMLGCTPHQLKIAADCFAQCLERVSMSIGPEGGDHVTDQISHHHWTIPPGMPPHFDLTRSLERCQCGLVSNQKSKLTFQYLGSGKCFTDKGPVACSDIDKPCDQNINVLDSYSASVNALQVAVATANMVLGICQVIHDTN